MIVRSFLNWYRSPSVETRIEAVAAMVDAYLSDQLGGASREEAEAALMLVLDDSAVSVRRMLAWSFAASSQAPRPLMVALAHDQPQVAALVLARSPQLKEADLIDCLRQGTALTHLAVALRPEVSAAVAGALAAHAGSEALVALCANARADIAPAAFRTMLDRWPRDAALREALSARNDLPATIRQALVQSLAGDLAGFVGRAGWLDPGRASRIANECTETATIALSATTPDLGAYVEHLRASAQLTPSLLLRTLMCGDIALFGAALVALSGLSPTRVAGILRGRGGAPLRALCDKAGLAPALVPAIAAALDHIRKMPAASGALRLNRHIIAAALSASLGQEEASVRPLIALLRRLDADAAREDARRITEEITAAGAAVVMDETGLVAPDTRMDTLDAWTQSIEAGLDLDGAMAEVDHYHAFSAEDLAASELSGEAPSAEDLSGADDAVDETEDMPPPATDTEHGPSPALARLLMLQGRLTASIADPAPVAADLAPEQPAARPDIAETAEAPMVDPDEAYRADLDTLFAATFGDAAEATLAEDAAIPPSAEALRVIDSLHDALDAGFFNSWDIRRRDAA